MAISPKQREALILIAEGRIFPTLAREEDGWFARWRAAAATDNPWVDDFVRAAVVTPLTATAEEDRHFTLHDAWLAALRSRTGRVVWPEAECAAFAADLERWHGSDDTAVRAALDFTFAPPPSATGSFTLSLPVPRGRRALRALGQAAAVFGPLRELRRQGRRLILKLSAGEAEAFVATGAHDLRAAGYTVTGAVSAAEVVAEAEVVADPAAADDRAFGARLKVHLAGQPVGAEEIRFLLEQNSPFVYFREHWIEIDRGILKEALRALERQDLRRLNRNAALAFVAGIGAVGCLEVRAAKAPALKAIWRRLQRSGTPPSAALTPPKGFVGQLAGYQQRGVAWLKFLAEQGFGALLADDMGLGKTVQTIAWLLSARPFPALVVAPLTLLSNWQHELKGFAPGLRVLVHAGKARWSGAGFRREVAAADVVITSYTLLVRDFAAVSSVAWEALVLDEAQAIKNPDTQAARAVTALKAPRRLALTGTPVENSVSDLWSLENFLNPGFLGDRRDFTERFARPLALDPLAAVGRRLREAIAPYVLRRLKTDSEIAAQLGEKREVREYCRLSAEQRADYEAALADYRASERTQGEVLALLTQLKLVCDGLQASERGLGQLAGGKLERLLELVAAIFDAGESVLVFTQYAKVGQALKRALEERFARRTPFLHGSLTPAERDAQVAEFNAAATPRAFVLSLKAGGFGLNLVKATHVIHFDRWWNPAVENQATDRAHRLGQRGTVIVHLMVAVGTVEERVDELLRKKGALAANLVSAHDSFLAGMAEDELERLVALEAETEASA